MNDTISRSALIAELEGFKMSLGDVVLRYVVDRVIGVVKNQPAVKPPEKRDCMNCKYTDGYFFIEPCDSCVTINGEMTNWETPDD